MSSPETGVCIKLLTLIDAQKFFINLCQSDAIPQPEPITPAELIAQLNSPDQSTYRIPMSISELRHCDLKSAPVQCCDVVVHPLFLAKSQAEDLFGDFLIQVMIEAIDAKYGIQLDGGKCVVLKNRRQLGTLVKHRIQNRDLDAVREEAARRQQQLAEEASRLRLPQNDVESSNRSQLPKNRRPLIEELPSQAPAPSAHSADVLAATSRLVLITSHSGSSQLMAEFHLPQVRDPSEIQLDMGEDRIRVQVPRLGVLREGIVEQRLKVGSDLQSEWLPDKELLLVTAEVLSI